MEREERIKEIARKVSKALLERDDFTYKDMACAIVTFVGVVDSISEEENNTSIGSFAEYVYNMLGFVHEDSDKPAWRPSTEHPLVDEEVIALVGENKMISFAHIVDKERCIDYDGWNIPEVRWWIPCPKIEED